MDSMWSQRSSDRNGNAQSIGSDVSRALIELCDERRFSDLTVTEVCDRAGVERVAFERCFVDLESCFATIYEEIAAEFFDRMSAAYESHGEWRDRIRAVAYEFVAFLREDPARAKLTVVESSRAGERALLARDRVFGSLVAFLDQGRQEPGAPDSITPATAESIAGGIFNLMRLAVETEQTDRYVAVLPEMMYAVVLIYQGPEAAAEELEIEPPVLVALSGGV